MNWNHETLCNLSTVILKKEKATVKSVIILKFSFLTLFKLWIPFKSEITFLVTKKTSY